MKDQPAYLTKAKNEDKIHTMATLTKYEICNTKICIAKLAKWQENKNLPLSENPFWVLYFSKVN